MTLLCLARDAASRLPDGVGTRADIIELIKQSQWVNLGQSPPESVNSVVSGALDRLHQQDCCVQYDTERKIWIYMHAIQKVDNPDWQNDPRVPNILVTNSLIPNRHHPMIDRWLAS